MAFKNEKGLTLIELLITIAVIAIVAAISIPVITNVIESSRTSSAGSMEAQVNAFIQKYSQSGEVTYDAATQTFTGFVDLDGNGVISNPAEIIETFTVDAGQFSVTVDSATNPTSATVMVGGESAGGTGSLTANFTIDYGARVYGPEQFVSGYSGLTNGAFDTWSVEASPVWTSNTPVLAIGHVDYAAEYVWLPLNNNVIQGYLNETTDFMIFGYETTSWGYGNGGWVVPEGSHRIYGEIWFVHYDSEGNVLPLS
jgi:type IV pilus assembly protein PilA